MREVYLTQLEELQTQFNTMLTLTEDCLHYGVCFGKVQKKLEEIQLIVERLVTLEKDIFHSCEILILRQQPVAQDLEFITRTIKQILDLRRIGELSLNSAKIIFQMPRECMLELLEQMAKLLFEMFDAFKQNNLKRVQEIENIMDSCFKQIKEQIAQRLEDSYQNAHWWLEILMLSKYFEKIADHIIAMAHA
ncbi:hypothetical protein LS71_001345 [Helicobacter jaachi]|uniref:PhoU domain-containing protein n=1 Tax=Helicobacter jaachi TaxID=1677920 RepID=A0A4U8TCM9_9HELI|nr:PhoU domain-containing protein [Helicobacter jaachi]TLD97424.1 hypothetical protein LS71_001345 [Helicobacter jaachi]